MPYGKVKTFDPDNLAALERGIWLALVLVVLSNAVSACGQAIGRDSPTKSFSDLATDYSDVECLTKGITLCGGNPNSMDLLRSLHASHDESSSIQALSKAAVAEGLHCAILMHMSNWQLRNCRLPVILHIRGSPYSSEADHFVLYLGDENGQARLLDERSTERLIPFWSLLIRWGGEALVLAPQQGDLQSVTTAWKQPCIYILSGVGLMILGISALQRRHMRFGQTTRSILHTVGISMIYCVFFAVAAVLLGSLNSDLSYGGILLGAGAGMARDDPNATAFWPRASLAMAAPLPEVDVGTALRLDREGVLFIDARDLNEYQAGHIHGALSVPATSEDSIRFRVLLIPKGQRLVVYCAEASCGKGRYVAEQLRDLGYADVSLYTEGWVKWPER